MKASIDTKEPHTRQGGKRRNPKKEQMMEERYAQIERDNRLLLEKMSYIMRHQSMDIREDTGEYSQSLNRERRKRELQRITRENQKILARIQAAEPTYDHLEWAEHERNHEERCSAPCELPLVIHGDPAPQDEDEATAIEGAATGAMRQIRTPTAPPRAAAEAPPRRGRGTVRPAGPGKRNAT